MAEAFEETVDVDEEEFDGKDNQIPKETNNVICIDEFKGKHSVSVSNALMQDVFIKFMPQKMVAQMELREKQIGIGIGSGISLDSKLNLDFQVNL